MSNTLGSTPLMQRSEIRHLEKELERLFDDYGRPLEILEWGSGGSTHYFTRFLKSKSIPYTWTSLEYNKKWYEKILKEVVHDKNIKLHLFDVGNDGLRQRKTNMDEYVDFPKTLGKEFDLVLVDGRKRRRCVLAAKDILSSRGVVFLHDAQRKYYQCVFKEFAGSRLLGVSLWRGDEYQKNTLLDFIKNTYWRSLQSLVIRPVYFLKRKLRRFLKK